MSDEAAPKPSRFRSMMKVVFGGFLGMCTGAVAMYSNALFDRVVKPSKPIANFAATADGLVATFQNMATGESGFWDFGDGTPLEPFDATKEKVSHEYKKPGSYKVTLSVRNFFLEENDRSVTVEVSTPTNSPAALPPSLKNWKVDRVSAEGQSPATYRVSAEVQNADELVWLIGDKSEHHTAQPGPLERYLVIDKPGTQPIMLTALSKTRQSPQVMMATVDVKSRAKDVYQAMLSVVDSKASVETVVRRESIVASVRTQSGFTKGFSRTITPTTPDAIYSSIELDPRQPKRAVRADRTKIVIAPDKKSATISGDWQLTGEALMRDAGGSDIPISLIVKEDRVNTSSPTPSYFPPVDINMQTGEGRLKLPPAPLPGVKRELRIEVDVLKTTGERIKLAQGPIDARGSWQGQFAATNMNLQFRATMTKDEVIVKVESKK